MWILHFMAAQAEWAKQLEVVNLFRYWKPAELVENGSMPAEAWWVLAGVALVSLVASVIVFSRRDVA